jgi:hypothetical protein
MSDIFASNNLVEIEVSYVVTKGRGSPIITVLSDDEAAKKKADPKEKDSVRTLHTKWKPQSWKTSQELLTKSQVYNHELQTTEIDPYKHRNARLLTLLTDWDGIDVKDEQGKTIPCTTEAINKLHVNLAIAILQKYDQIGLPDTKDVEKNS